MLQYEKLTSGNVEVDRVMAIIGWKAALRTGLPDELDNVITEYYCNLCECSLAQFSTDVLWSLFPL